MKYDQLNNLYLKTNCHKHIYDNVDEYDSNLLLFTGISASVQPSESERPFSFSQTSTFPQSNPPVLTKVYSQPDAGKYVGE